MSGRFVFDPERCCGCGACVVACMDQNDFDPAAGASPYRRCEMAEQGLGMAAEMRWSSVGCMHCEDAPCIAACPMGCITRDGETGLVLCDGRACIGCHRCEAACPCGAPVFGPDGKMRKCDGCIDRVRAGLLPACVKGCPFGALRFETE